MKGILKGQFLRMFQPCHGVCHGLHGLCRLCRLWRLWHCSARQRSIPLGSGVIFPLSIWVPNDQPYITIPNVSISIILSPSVVKTFRCLEVAWKLRQVSPSPNMGYPPCVEGVTVPDGGVCTPRCIAGVTREKTWIRMIPWQSVCK